MAAISAFPDIPDTMHGAFGTEVTKTASADILGGQAVQINSNGTVAPATASTQKIIGVALYDIPAGTIGAVRVAGVARAVAGATVAAGATAITAGAAVTAGTLGGVTAHSTGTALGIALEPIAGGATGLVALGVFTA